MIIVCLIGLFFVFLASSYIWYQQGYRAGYEDGNRDTLKELNKDE